MVDFVKREVRIVKYKTGEYDLTNDFSFKELIEEMVMELLQNMNN
jgi:hypothetical protein